jgi:hypothetical protein
MNIKQKMVRERDAKDMQIKSNRYLQNKNCDSTPALTKLHRETHNLNKENNLNEFNANCKNYQDLAKSNTFFNLKT